MTRLEALDGARFLAFCGMVLVNFRIAAEVAPGSDWASVLINALEGRAAALFVVLAGIGIGLSSVTAPTLLRRAAFLFVLGLINMSVFDADILHFYALYFCVGAAFLTAHTGRLWGAALGLVAASLVAMMVFDYDHGWNWETLTYPDLWSFAGFWRNALFNGWHPVLPWAAFLLIGMAIGRADLATICIQHRLIMWGFAAAVLALLPQMFTSDPDMAAILDTESLPPGPFYIMAGTGSACVVIGLSLKLWPHIERLGAAQFLTAPGRQSLTLYMAHIFVGMAILEEANLLNGTLTAPHIVLCALVFCAISALYAVVWARFFTRGPLEALMRLTTRTAKA